MKNKTQKQSDYAKIRYARFRAKGLCVKACGEKSDPKRNMCHTCYLSGAWKRLRSGEFPITESLGAFINWYTNKITKCKGACEWCNTPFSIKEPVIDHDHENGRLRALLCYRCNLAEGIGLDRMKKVLPILESRYWLREELASESEIEHNLTPIFVRLTRLLHTKHTREKQMQKAVQEIRRIFSSEETVSKCYEQFKEHLYKTGIEI